jgi:hypothetical protein
VLPQHSVTACDAATAPGSNTAQQAPIQLPSTSGHSTRVHTRPCERHGDVTNFMLAASQLH